MAAGTKERRIALSKGYKLFTDMHANEIVVIFRALSTASNKGFTYGVATTGHVLKDDLSIVRVTQVWCGPKSTSLIYTTVWLLVFHALPALGG